LSIKDASLAEIKTLIELSNYSRAPISYAIGLAFIRFIDESISTSRLNQTGTKAELIDFLLQAFSIGLLGVQIVTKDRPSFQTSKLAFAMGILLGLYTIAENLDFKTKEVVRYFARVGNFRELVISITGELVENGIVKVTAAISNTLVSRVLPKLADLHLTTDLKERVFNDTVSIFSFATGTLIGLYLGLIIYVLYSVYIKKQDLKTVLKNKKFLVMVALVLGGTIGYAYLKSIISNATARNKVIDKLITKYSSSLIQAKGISQNLLKKWTQQVMKQSANRLKAKKSVADRIDQLVTQLEKLAKEASNLCMKIQYEAAAEVLKQAITTIPDLKDRFNDHLTLIFWSMQSQKTHLINAYSALSVIDDKFYPKIAVFFACDPEDLKDEVKYKYYKTVLKGALAHEIGHAYFMHTVQHIVQNLTLFYVGALLVLSLRKLKLSKYTAALVYYTIGTFFGNYFRRMEYQADAFAAEIEPEGARLALEHLKQMHGEMPPEAFEEMHGHLDKRIKHIQRYLERLSKVSER